MSFYQSLDSNPNKVLYNIDVNNINVNTINGSSYPPGGSDNSVGPINSLNTADGNGNWLNTNILVDTIGDISSTNKIHITSASNVVLRETVNNDSIELNASDGGIRLSANNSSSIYLSSANQINIQNLIYPNADGTSGQVLTTDGDGNLTFQSVGGGSFPSYAPGLVFVSQLNGNDSNNGSFASPVATIGQGLILGPGGANASLIYILDAELYPENITVNSNQSIYGPSASVTPATGIPITTTSSGITITLLYVNSADGSNSIYITNGDPEFNINTIFAGDFVTAPSGGVGAVALNIYGILSNVTCNQGTIIMSNITPVGGTVTGNVISPAYVPTSLFIPSSSYSQLTTNQTISNGAQTITYDTTDYINISSLQLQGDNQTFLNTDSVTHVYQVIMNIGFSASPVTGATYFYAPNVTRTSDTSQFCQSNMLNNIIGFENFMSGNQIITLVAGDSFFGQVYCSYVGTVNVLNGIGNCQLQIIQIS